MQGKNPCAGINIVTIRDMKIDTAYKLIINSN